MTQKLRVGVIGAGLFASMRHLPDLAASPEAEVVAVCRRDPEALGKVAAHFGVPHRFTDYARLLDEVELDAVVVSSPHGLHFEHVRAALGPQDGEHGLGDPRGVRLGEPPLLERR